MTFHLDVLLLALIGNTAAGRSLRGSPEGAAQLKQPFSITDPAKLFLPHFPPNTKSHPSPANTRAPHSERCSKMSSQQKINSARANGAKSRGPITETGRKKSARNAVTHGLYSASVVLHTESIQEYQEMLDAYTGQFQPANQAEFHLIEEMIAAKWRQRRLWDIEAHLLELEIAQQTEKLDKQYTSYGSITPLSLAYSSLASSGPLPFLTRNESRLERAYSRALKNLLELQRLRKAAQPNTRQNLQGQPPAPDPSPVFPLPTTHNPPLARPTAEQNLQERTQAQIPTPPKSAASTAPVPSFPTTHHPQPTTRQAQGLANKGLLNLADI
jgi:hypothetical protein